MTARNWKDLSWDPNALDVVEWRAAQLRRSRREPVRSRVEHLRELAAGKAVLDIGVVEHDASNADAGRWLHRHLVEVADRCLGVDILEQGVLELQSQGFDVLCRDITEAPLEESFDVIVAGELIEHVGNPGALFTSVAKMLNPGGTFVLTTPNPYMLHRTWKHLRGGFPDSVDHVAYFHAGNLAELADRSGLELTSWRGIALKRLTGYRNRTTTGLRDLLTRTIFSAEISCDSIIYEFGPAEDA